MDSRDRYLRLQEVFTAACKVAPFDRGTFLDEACGDDTELRARVESMLAYDEQTTIELDRPALDCPEFTSPDARLAGLRVGSYRLQRVLASGGMGTVYEAEQDNPQRKVAVKVMRPGLAANSALRRFDYESQVLARLNHPGIAQVFDAGTIAEADSLPYFVMEFVADARPVTDYARVQGLHVRARLGLFCRICESVQHGHQKGIIHRDLKPANILVDAAGQPKIIDFGIARATDSDLARTTMLTDVGQLIGTLQYMSPEQCEADPHNLDTRSDVYALGVVLFELLTDALPYDVSKSLLHEAVQVIREREPTRLGALDQALRGDLETITHKALEKERERRYGSAAELAADIARHLNDEPVTARPPSTIYQLRKFAKRHRAFVAALTIVFVVLTSAVIVTSIAFSREADQRVIADENATRATRERDAAQAILDFVSWDLLYAVSPHALGHEVTMHEALDSAAERLEGRFGDAPLVKAALHDVLGLTYRELGEIEKAEPHLAEGVALNELARGPEAPETIHAKTMLAALYEVTGRYDEAEDILVPLLATTRRCLGEDHIRTASVLGELGHIAHERGEFASAERYQRDALAILRRIPEAETRDIASCLSNLAMACKYLRKFEQAESLYEECAAVLSENYSEDHPRTLNCRANLGALYYSTGKYDRAVAVFRDVVEAQRSALPADHRLRLAAELNLATNLDMSGEHEEGLRLAQDLLPRMSRALGPGDKLTVVLTNNLANMLCDAGQLDEAEPLLRGIIDRLGIETKSLYVPAAMARLARIRASRGDLAEALTLYPDAIKRLEAIYAEHHPDVLVHRSLYATECLLPARNFESAEAELLATHTIALEHYGADNRQVVECRRSLIHLYEAWNKPVEAAKWR